MDLADAKFAGPTHTAEQSKQEIASVTPPIVLGKGEQVAVQPTDPAVVTGDKTDSPDPIRLKNEDVHLTNEYLALDKVTPNNADEQKALDAQRKAKLAAIKAKFEALRAAMTIARGESPDRPLTLARVKFEKFLGTKATGEWDQGTKCVDTMANEAKNMILAAKNPAMLGAAQLDDALKALPKKDADELGGKLGTPSNIGFAGAVGNDFKRLVDTLTGGSLVQKAQTLINFGQKFLMDEVLSQTGPVYARVAENLKKVVATDPAFDLAGRLQEAQGKDPKKQYKLLFQSKEFRDKMHSIEKEQNAQNDATRKAEANAAGEPDLIQSKDPGQNTVLEGAMDSKIPQQPVELLNEVQLDFVAKQGLPRVDFTQETRDEA